MAKAKREMKRRKRKTFEEILVSSRVEVVEIVLKGGVRVFSTTTVVMILQLCKEIIHTPFPGHPALRLKLQRGLSHYFLLLRFLRGGRHPVKSKPRTDSSNGCCDHQVLVQKHGIQELPEACDSQEEGLRDLGFLWRGRGGGSQRSRSTLRKLGLERHHRSGSAATRWCGSGGGGVGVARRESAVGEAQLVEGAEEL